MPVIRRFLPYSSRDLDLVAEQKSQVDAIKAVVNLKCTEAEQGYGGIDRAAFQTRKGETVIQVLASMYSVSIGDLRKHTRELKFDVAGRTVDVRVADLSVLLKDKIELSLALRLDQRPARQEE